MPPSTKSQKDRILTADTEFIFVRHAESTANASPHDASTQTSDPILTKRGVQQAAQLTEWIASRDVNAIYASNTSRARATAEPIEYKFGLRGFELPEIDEWNLGKNGKVDELRLHEMFDRWCAGDLDTNLEGAPHSETLNDMIARVVPTFQSIFERHKEGSGVILIVAHGGAISWTMPAFAQNVSMRFAVQNYLGNCCSVSVVSNDGRPHVVRWADKPLS